MLGGCASRAQTPGQLIGKECKSSADSPLKYTSAFPATDSDSWTLSACHSRHFLNTFNENNARPDGIIQNKLWSREKKMNLVYRIIAPVRGSFEVAHIATSGYDVGWDLEHPR